MPKQQVGYLSTLFLKNEIFDSTFKYIIKYELWGRAESKPFWNISKFLRKERNVIPPLKFKDITHFLFTYLPTDKTQAFVEKFRENH